MSHLSKVRNALLGLLFAPFYELEERERERKLRERLSRLEEKTHQTNAWKAGG
jgi:hypothetical protein